MKTGSQKQTLKCVINVGYVFYSFSESVTVQKNKIGNNIENPYYSQDLLQKTAVRLAQAYQNNHESLVNKKSGPLQLFFSPGGCTQGREMNFKLRISATKLKKVDYIFFLLFLTRRM